MTMTTTITAKDVAELRARTGAGMMDCKKALEETGATWTRPIELLRKKGIAKAEKRADRAASRRADRQPRQPATAATAALVEVNCETDFVARNEEFGKLVEQHRRRGDERRERRRSRRRRRGRAAAREADADSSTVEGAIEGRCPATTGENRRASAASRASTPTARVGSYVHFNGKVGRARRRRRRQRRRRCSSSRARRRARRGRRPDGPGRRRPRRRPDGAWSSASARIFIEQAAESGKPASDHREDGRGPDRQVLQGGHAPRPAVGARRPKTIGDLVKDGGARGLKSAASCASRWARSSAASWPTSATTRSCSSSPARRSPGSKGFGFDFDASSDFAGEIEGVVEHGRAASAS